MNTATIVAQSRNLCVGRIGHYSFNISSTTVVKSIVSPAGEFPLMIYCQKRSSTQQGFRASIYINGTLDSPSGPEWRGLYAASSNYAKNIDSTCSSAWSVQENSNFVNAGGSLASATVWPCPVSATADIEIFRIVKFANTSPTARKVSLVLTADNITPAASFGPYSFNQNSVWYDVLTHKIYVEPGIYTFSASVVDMGAAKAFIAAILIDDILVSKTGDAGWSSFLENGQRGPFTPAGNCTVNSWGVNVRTQFIAEIGVMPSWIWPGGGKCFDNTTAYEYARFQFDVDVRPKENQPAHHKIDFQFSADDLFMMRIDSGPLIVGSPRDAENYLDKFYPYTSTYYSLYLMPGTYRLQFSIANYSTFLKNTHLQGIISERGSIIGVTNSNDGKWTGPRDQNVVSCSSQLHIEWNPLLLELQSPFVNSGIQMIAVGSCSGSVGVTDIFFTLWIPGAVSSVPFSRTISHIFSASSNVSPSRSILISSMTYPGVLPSTVTSIMDLPRLFTSRAVLSFAETTAATKDSSFVLEDTNSATKKIIKPYSSVKNDIALSFVQKATSNAGPLIIIGLSMLAVAATLAFVVLKKVCLVTSPNRDSSRNGSVTPSVFSKFSGGPTEDVITASDETMQPSIPTVTTSQTVVNTTTLQALSIPAYLQIQEGLDFRADKCLSKGTAADLMIGTPFVKNLSAYGKKIIVKRFSPRKEMTESQRVVFLQEVSITAYFQTSKNIVRMLGYTENPPSLILKFYQLGSLRNWLSSKKHKRSKSLLLSFMRDIGQGLGAIHRSGFAHCDIKSDNVLVDIDTETGQFYSVICDFGITQVIDSSAVKVQSFVVANRQGFSLMYAAPEVFVAYRSKYSLRQYSCDIYAYGVLGIELLNGGKLNF
eukprot:Partr_v1_DN26292_c4_g2_i1_m48533